MIKRFWPKDLPQITDCELFIFIATVSDAEMLAIFLGNFETMFMHKVVKMIGSYISMGSSNKIIPYPSLCYLFCMKKSLFQWSNLLLEDENDSANFCYFSYYTHYIFFYFIIMWINKIKSSLLKSFYCFH